MVFWSTVAEMRPPRTGWLVACSFSMTRVMRSDAVVREMGVVACLIRFAISLSDVILVNS